MKLEVSRGRCGVLMFLIDRANPVESSEIIEPRVSRSLILSTRTWRVSSIGIDPYVSIENLILAAAAVACVCLIFVICLVNVWRLS